VAATARSPLSRERVLQAAMDIADAEGLAAVSMRRVAAKLGVEAMSLYHHLPGKEGLLDGLVERLAGAILAESATATAAAPGDWRAEVRARSLAARRVMIRHPWGPALITSRAAVPFEIQLVFEAVLAAMIRGGLSYRIAHRGMHALSSMALGFVQEPFSAPGPAQPEPVMDAAVLAAMAEHFPHTSAMVAAELHADGEPSLGWCDTQTEFEFTLGLLLDGLARAAAEG
jgi:AcrR family transcriptional regulator